MKYSFFLMVTGCSLFCFFLESCSNPGRIPPDLRPGFAQYQACLKQCDSLEIVYEHEHRVCNTSCPAPMPNPELCNHVPPQNRQACINQQIAPIIACEKCAMDYAKHMEEIDSCKQACLNTFKNLFPVDKQ